MTGDPVDAIMAVMQAAFDPAYGEAWTRRQVADSLVLPNTHYLLSGHDESAEIDPRITTGFTMSRSAADEEELLLIAVRPEYRGNGIGRNLLERLFEDAQRRRISRLFLEMRSGNPAEHLYRSMGFEQIGLRKGYYRGAVGGPLDAITLARDI